MRFLFTAAIVIAMLVAVAVGGLALLAVRSRARPRPSGPSGGGTLAPCPGSPNCVTSLAADPGHAIEPLRFDDATEAAWGRLRAVLASWPDARTAGEGPGYLHVEFRSRFFGFVDDAEFLLDAPNRRVDVRSASRVGWSDGGVNRGRILAIAHRFARPG